MHLTKMDNFIQLHLPKNTIVPTFYFTCQDPKEISQALAHGVQINEKIKVFAAGEASEEQSHSLESTKKELQESFDKKFNKTIDEKKQLDKKLQESEDNLLLLKEQLRSVRENMKQEFETNLSLIKTTLSIGKEEEINNLKEQLSDLKKERKDFSEQLAQINNSFKKELLTAEEKFDKKEESLRKIFKQEKDEYQKREDELNEKLRSTTFIKNNTKHRGDVGEMIVGDILSKIFPECDLKHTGKTKHATDFNLDVNGAEIVVDAKLYTTTVGTDQITKLKKDMNVRKHVSIGVLLSLESNVAKCKTFDVEFLNDDDTNPIRCIIIVSNLISYGEYEARMSIMNLLGNYIRFLSNIKKKYIHTDKTNIDKALKEFKKCVDLIISIQTRNNDMLSLVKSSGQDIATLLENMKTLEDYMMSSQ